MITSEDYLELMNKTDILQTKIEKFLHEAGLAAKVTRAHDQRPIEIKPTCSRCAINVFYNMDGDDVTVREYKDHYFSTHSDQHFGENYSAVCREIARIITEMAIAKVFK